MQSVQRLIRSAGGAIPIAHFMRLALTNPTDGYYTRSNGENKIFGRSGDFITSPEISALFGEMIGVWLLRQASQLDRDFCLIELGPGRGTLMADILKTWWNLPHLTPNFSGLHMVEPSIPLRGIQRQTLAKAIGEPLISSPGSNPDSYTLFGLPINWYSHLDEVPMSKDISPVIVAHEMLDALPIHQFKLTQKGWKEVLISSFGGNTDHLRFVLSPTEAPKNLEGSLLPPVRDDSPYSVGDYFEASPESSYLAAQFARRIIKAGSGLALAVDYGFDGIKKTATFRGVRNHQFVNPLENVGETDLTADVDFRAITKAVQSVSKDIETFPVLTQREFLESVGIKLRMDRICAAQNDSDTQRRLISSCDRLLSTSTGMGEVYKFWTIRAGIPADPFPFSSTTSAR